MSIVDVIDRAKDEGRTVLTEIESKQVLARPASPSPQRPPGDRPRTRPAKAAKKMGFPVVLKIVSPDITHKSDVGGVKLGLDSEEDGRRRRSPRSWRPSARSSQPKARIEGVAVQKMAPAGHRGDHRHEQGPAVRAGAHVRPRRRAGRGAEGRRLPHRAAGAARRPPDGPRDQGLPRARRRPRPATPADLAALEKLLLKVSAFVEAHPEIEELDLNPVFAYTDGAIAVDARIVVAVTWRRGSIVGQRSPVASLKADPQRPRSGRWPAPRPAATSRHGWSAPSTRARWPSSATRGRWATCG